MRWSPAPTARPLRLALVGFGNVGQALARLLLAKRADAPFTVTAILTATHGWHVDRAGIDLDETLRSERLPSSGQPPPARELPADVLVELTTLEPRTGRPAYDHIIEALRARMHVVTANKGPIAHRFAELREAAWLVERELRFEATVADCLPVFTLRRSALPLAEIRAIRGIVSSTTNHILSAAARGIPFGEALAEAQLLGIAEADPSNDLEGWDAAAKATILANVLMGARIAIDDVRRESIDERVAEEAARAAQEGARLRPIVEMQRREPVALASASGYVPMPVIAGGLRPPSTPHPTGRRPRVEVSASFGPRRLEPLDPLYAVDGWSMALELDTDLAGKIVVQLHDPHVEQVAYAVLTDLLEIAGWRT